MANWFTRLFTRGRPGAKRESRSDQRAAGDVWADVDLERQVELSDSLEAWQVWADALLEHGDPRGELIVCAMTGTGFEETLGRLEQTVLGKFAKSRQLTLEWRRGLVHAARLNFENREQAQALVEQFLALPVARLVRGISFCVDDLWRGTSTPYPKALAALAPWPHTRQLRALTLGGVNEDAVRQEASISGMPLGELDCVNELAPDLDLLELSGLCADNRFAHLVAPRLWAPGTTFRKLKVFTLDTGALSQENCRVIAATSWPELERLELSTGTAAGGATASLEDLGPVLAGSTLPRLKHLALSSPFAAAALSVLTDSPLLQRLRVVDVATELDEAEVESIIEQAHSFEHLELLDLSRCTYLGDDDVVAELVARLPNATFEQARVREGTLGERG